MHKSYVKPLHPECFSERYKEKHLENLLKKRPEILAGGEPLLIIGQQVQTALTGKIDLLGFDSSGASVIVELKRDKAPRTVLAQGLEYAAWVSEIPADQLIGLANNYLSNLKPPGSLLEAWQQTFGGSLDDVSLNSDQRIVIAAEGSNQRIVAVANYLTLKGLDSALIEYHYHQADGEIEILEFIEHRGPADPEKTESKIVAKWPDASKVAYRLFRERMIVSIDNLEIEPKKDRISFIVASRGGDVFLFSYMSQKKKDVVELRRSSLQKVVDVDKVIASLTNALVGEQDIDLAPDKQNQIYYLRFLPTRENADSVATSLIENVATKIE